MKLGQAPLAEDAKLAALIHRDFARQPGSDHIATEFALKHLSRLLSETSVPIDKFV